MIILNFLNIDTPSLTPLQSEGGKFNIGILGYI